MSMEGFIAEQIKAIGQFRSALSKESDRGCALFAAAYLDKALSDLLYCALASDKKIENDLFEGNAPLATFSSRIKVAYYLGFLSKAERRDLDLIRKIRNDFAHHAEDISFETESISGRCKALEFSYHEKGHRERGHFTAAALGLIGNIHIATLTCKAPEIKPDNVPTQGEKNAHREKISRVLSGNDEGD